MPHGSGDARSDADLLYRLSGRAWDSQVYPRRAWILLVCLVVTVLFELGLMIAAWGALGHSGAVIWTFVSLLSVSVAATWWFYFEWWTVQVRYRHFLNHLQNTVPEEQFMSVRFPAILDRVSLQSALILLCLISSASILAIWNLFVSYH